MIAWKSKENGDSGCRMKLTPWPGPAERLDDGKVEFGVGEIRVGVSCSCSETSVHLLHHPAETYSDVNVQFPVGQVGDMFFGTVSKTPALIADCDPILRVSTPAPIRAPRPTAA